MTYIPASASIVDHQPDGGGQRVPLHDAEERRQDGDGAQRQKIVSVIYSPFGSVGSQRVDTGWVWADSRSRS